MNRRTMTILLMLAAAPVLAGADGDPATVIATVRQMAEFLRQRNPQVQIHLMSTWSRADQVYDAKGAWYGKPIAHWLSVLQEAGPMKHMEYVALLKSEHKLGHGHANALVAFFPALEVNRGLPAKYLVKHFTRAGLDWQISDNVRSMVTFQRFFISCFSELNHTARA